MNPGYLFLMGLGSDWCSWFTYSLYMSMDIIKDVGNISKAIDIFACSLHSYLLDAFYVPKCIADQVGSIAGRQKLNKKY